MDLFLKQLFKYSFLSTIKEKYLKLNTANNAWKYFRTNNGQKGKTNKTKNFQRITPKQGLFL